ncbi:MAG: hypothetical protein AAGG69_02780 [Pseudomonadota bacterium]
MTDKSIKPKKKLAPKQAVVVIHGMGQQKPMETLRSMVRVLWETDPSLTDNKAKATARHDEPPKSDEGTRWNKVWLVPDTRTGSKELARITTPAADNGLRTDFYEFYWADIMEGTTKDHLTAWISGLLLRWPHQVPKDVISAWLVLWATTLFGIAMAINGFVSVLGGGDPSPWLSSDHEVIWRVLLTVGTLAIILFNIDRLVKRSQPQRLRFWDVLFAITVPIGVALLIGRLVPFEVIASAGFLSFAATFLVGLLIQQFMLPYFGDVARYVRAGPDTVAKRAEVRRRGLELLRALHDPVRRNDAFNKLEAMDADQARPYERIVIVAHSLGTIVAYDLLRHFWAERGPVSGGVIDKAGEQALKKMDAYIKEHAPDGRILETFDLAKFRVLQREVSEALANPMGGWLITDLVTLGSPLTHAEFLLANDEPELDEWKWEGLVPTCPPTPDPTEQSIMYQPQGSKTSFARHTSLFSAVRWTNICDTHSLILRGDIISGLLDKTMGEGIADYDVAIHLKGLRNRIFTHTSYWDATASSTLKNNDRATPAHAHSNVKDPHIKLLREGVNIDEDISAKRRATKELVV